jgi:hypothetical protein
LIERIAALLEEAKIKNGNVSDLESSDNFDEADSILPESGSTKALLSQYIGDMSMATFMFDTLANARDVNLRYEKRAIRFRFRI